MSKLPDTSNRIDLTATQYVILAEKQRKKKALADTKEAYSKLLADNTALVQQLQAAQRDNYQVTEHFRREVLVKNDRIAALQTQLDQLRAQHDTEMQQQRQSAEQREAELRQEAQEQVSQLVAQVSGLQEELAAVLEFKQQRADHTAVLAALREENQGLRETLSAQKAQLERYYAGLNAKMRKEYEQKLEELKRSGEEELQERLGAGVKRVLGQNRRLAEELQLHVQESDALVSEVKVLEADRGRLSRELELKQALEEGWAKRGAVQAAALKEAQAHIAGLEANLQQVLTDFAAERSSLVAAAAARVQEAEGERDALRRLLQLKTRELKQVRRLGQEVLLQRSAVEAFLLAALQQVQQEKGPEQPFVPPSLPMGSLRAAGTFLQLPTSPRSAAAVSGLSPRSLEAASAAAGKAGTGEGAVGGSSRTVTGAAPADASKQLRQSRTGPLLAAAQQQQQCGAATAEAAPRSSKVPSLPAVVGVSAAVAAVATAAAAPGSTLQLQPSVASLQRQPQQQQAAAASSSGGSVSPRSQPLTATGSNGGAAAGPGLSSPSEAGTRAPPRLSSGDGAGAGTGATSSSNLRSRQPPPPAAAPATAAAAAAAAAAQGVDDVTGTSDARGSVGGTLQGVDEGLLSMSWGEREKVLRLLLAKITNAAKAQQSAQLPEHTTGVPAGSS